MDVPRGVVSMEEEVVFCFFIGREMILASRGMARTPRVFHRTAIEC